MVNLYIYICILCKIVLSCIPAPIIYIIGTSGCGGKNMHSIIIF